MELHKKSLIFTFVAILCAVLSANALTKDKAPADAEYDKYEEMVELPGGKFTMGSTAQNGKDGESVQRKVSVKPFKINKYPITNAAFRKFIRAKKYKTDAEKYTWSFVFDAFVSEEIKQQIEQRLPGAPWWIPVEQAHWRKPEGKGSGIEKRLHYPVVHVSQVDARAFCQWHGWRLPTEAEWEYAARGGLEGKTYPWGNKFEKNRMNIWQGKFPAENKKSDGYHGVAPVDAFPAQNDYGLFDMIGNAWEWTSTRFSPTPSAKDDAPPSEKEDPTQVRYVLRGASYIDSKDGKFNHATRVTTRMGNEADAGSDNLGFRCAVSMPTGTSEKKPKGKKKDAPTKDDQEPITIELPEGAKVVRPNPADLNGKGNKKRKQEL
ncbi:inactive C-alpha-formylglycine-generating enzyme 2-like [Diadema antillarum]|uniref:inactive C-alpha-formylglycine-generating enzyme 2-like n=1 Tax=Diadema antillarum TaxID=105358 RepID=UPI003A8B15E2